MPISNPVKRVSADTIPCNGSTQVTLGFTAAPGLRQTPADIVLIMDRSGSMDESRMPQAKEAAKSLLNTISLASDGQPGLTFGADTRVGLVSFAGTASVDSPLTDSLPDLEVLIDSYVGDGWTGHADAFTKAASLLTDDSKRRVIVMFTDGETNVGAPPAPVAKAIRETGVEIYCVAMDVNETELNTWASDPDDRHVFMAADADGLALAFEEAGKEIVQAGGLDVVLDETLSDAFQIKNLMAPSHGTVQLLDAHTLHWTMDSIGVTASETATLTFDAVHIGSTGGTMPVNASIHFADKDSSAPVFPDPLVTVVCSQEPIIITRPCPDPVPVTLERCQDSARVDLPPDQLDGLGRILQLNVTIQNICPHKRVAVAVLLNELDRKGHEFPRGMKTFLIPAQNWPRCRDVTLRCIPFVLPEVLDVSGGSPDSLCNQRNFNVRVLANYLDTDFTCCTVQTP